MGKVHPTMARHSLNTGRVRPDRWCIKQAEDFWETTTPRGGPPRADVVTRGAPGPSPAKALGDRGQRLGLPLLAWVGMPTKGGSQGCLGRVWEWKVKPWQRGTEGRDLRHQGRS